MSSMQQEESQAAECQASSTEGLSGKNPQVWRVQWELAESQHPRTPEVWTAHNGIQQSKSGAAASLCCWLWGVSAGWEENTFFCWLDNFCGWHGRLTGTDTTDGKITAATHCPEGILVWSVLPFHNTGLRPFLIVGVHWAFAVAYINLPLTNLYKWKIVFKVNQRWGLLKEAERHVLPLSLWVRGRWDSLQNQNKGKHSLHGKEPGPS